MKKELGEIVHVAMSGLSERDRQLLIWRFQDQCTFVEMGRRLGCTAEGAHKAWRKAIERFRDIIDWSSTPV
jgi:RNA polymerase sigma-70 factor, ECF subfamily